MIKTSVMRPLTAGGAVGPGMMGVAGGMPQDIDADVEYQKPSLLERYLPHALLAATGLGVGAYDEFAAPRIRAAANRVINRIAPSMTSKTAAFARGLADGMTKLAPKDAKKRKMPHFTDQDRPEGVKKVYRALKKKAPEMRMRYGGNWKEVAARVAARQGKTGKQHKGPPYKAPIGE